MSLERVHGPDTPPASVSPRRRARRARLSRPRWRNPGRPNRSARSCHSRPARPSTSWRASCSTRCRSSSASPSSWRTAPAPAARSAAPWSRAPSRTATRCWSIPPRMRRRRRSIPICPTTPRAISPRSRRSAVRPTSSWLRPKRATRRCRNWSPPPNIKPGGFTYGTPGVGSATHLSTERFRLSAGFDGVHVPFRGMPEALTEVMTGRVDFACSTIASALPFIRDGKLVALAVSTPQRSSALARRADHAGARLRQFRLHVLDRACSRRPRRRARSSSGCIRRR